MPTVHDVVLSVLRASGTDILKDADKFRNQVISQVDGASKERKALEIGCDSKYLGILSGTGTKDELSAAADAAADYLINTYVMDAEVATSVSYEIAYALAEFLGIDAPSAKRRRKFAAKRSGFSIPAIMALVLSTVFLAAGLYASHVNPIFGCTLFPSSGRVKNIACKWYGVRDSAGQELTVVFLKNDGDESKRISSAEGHAIKGTLAPTLAAKDEGLMLVQGLGGLTHVKTNTSFATKESLGTMPVRRVTWSYKTNSQGMPIISMTNPTDTTIRLHPNSIMLASKGATASVCAVKGLSSLEPGVTEIDVNSSLVALTPHSGSMKPGRDTDLYLNGLKVPLTSE